VITARTKKQSLHSLDNTCRHLFFFQKFKLKNGHMKATFKLISTAFIVCIFPHAVQAQDIFSKHQTTFSLETDPTTFLLDGYALHFRIKPAESSHLVIGAGTYSMKLPNVIVNLNPNDKGEGWNTRIKNAYSLYGEYYFKEAFSKFFAGLQAGVQNYRLSNNNESASSAYRTVMVMPMFGYVWQPFNFPLYVKPWLGVGYNSKISGSTVVGSSEYELSRLMPLLTFHIGYKFGARR
jgi:hypothetical protein